MSLSKRFLPASRYVARASGVAAGARIGFAPGFWPTVAVMIALAVLLGLGTWQVERLQWKRALIAEREVQLAAPPQALPAASEAWAEWEFRPAVVEGVFRHDLEQQFGIATVDGRLGHHVLTPLVRPGGVAVLVDRGWVPADRVHPAARREGQLPGAVRVSGIARHRGDDRPGWFTPDNQPDQRLWYWYDLAALENALGLELLPVVIEADDARNPGGLPIGGQTRIELTDNHLQYAITWYGLAAGLLAIWIGFGAARGRERC